MSVAATMNGAAAEKSPGTVTSGRCSCPAGSIETDSRPPANARSCCVEHELGVVAGRRGLDDGGRAVRVEPGEQDRRLHLRARHREHVLDSLQRIRPFDDDGRFAVRRLDARAHPLQRLGDAVHRSRAKRLVAGELEASFLSGEDSGEQPHERARVAGVDRSVREPAGRAARRRARRARRRRRRRPGRRASARRRSSTACRPSVRTRERVSRRPRARRSARLGARSTCRRARRCARRAIRQVRLESRPRHSYVPVPGTGTFSENRRPAREQALWNESRVSSRFRTRA